MEGWGLMVFYKNVKYLENCYIFVEALPKLTSSLSLYVLWEKDASPFPILTKGEDGSKVIKKFT